MSRHILRICITTKDIMLIEECSQRSASQKMNDMREFYNKTESRHKITFKEYAKYTLIPLEDLEPFRLPPNYRYAS